jgi:hypothetical protein
MVKKQPSPYVGKLVYLRETWGRNKGMVDERALYIVRNCGPKMATLDRVNKETLQKDGWRGRTFYLTPKEEAEQRMAQYRDSFYYWDWSQLFVPQGEAGWDPDRNW